MGTPLSQYEIKTIEDLALQHGGSPAEALSAFTVLKQQGFTIEAVIANYSQSSANDDEIAEAIANEGGYNVATEHQDYEAQAGAALSQQAEALGRHADGKLAGSHINRQSMQFGDYLNKWFLETQHILSAPENPSSKKAIHQQFLKDTKLVGKITAEQLDALSTKDSEGIYLAAPDKQLANHIYAAIKESDLKTPRRSFFLAASNAAYEASPNIVSLKSTHKRTSMTFDDYINKCLKTVESELKESGKDYSRESVCSAFIAKTGLTEQLTTEDIEALSSKEKDGRSQAAPNEHLTLYLFNEIQRNALTDVRYDSFSNAANVARVASEKVIGIDADTALRTDVEPAVIMIKLFIRKLVEDNGIILRDIAPHTGVTEDALYDYQNLSSKRLPKAYHSLHELSVNKDTAETLDSMLHMHWYPNGIQSLKSLTRFVCDQTDTLMMDIDDRLGTHNLRFQLMRETKIPTRNKVLLKSWLHESLSSDQFAHLGITTDILDELGLKDVPLVTSPTQQKTIEAVYDCDVLQGSSTSQSDANKTDKKVIRFLIQTEGIIYKNLEGSLNINNLEYMLNLNRSTQISKEVYQWANEMLADEKYDLIRDKIPDLHVKERNSKPVNIDEPINSASSMAKFVAAQQNTSLKDVATQLGTRKITALLGNDSLSMNAVERRKIGDWVGAELFDEDGNNKHPNTPNKMQVHQLLNAATSKAIRNSFVPLEEISTLPELFTCMLSYEYPLQEKVGPRQRKVVELIGSEGKKMDEIEREIVETQFFDALSSSPLADIRDQLPSDEEIIKMLDEQTAKTILKARETIVCGATPTAQRGATPSF